ncbi:Invasion protein B, involved in pathogenesis [Bartonella doshiae]|uniref:Invasion protein B, involved in pathogenesis n=1 Tax=Bartonella doshiae TaxID=33044 RepID=A0A380ZE20_BARDO|nr:invasion associated locus B family protein [Bartonella doshiae]SUV44572.1 Invasion protein B, involved in pathogenesis [Bartonella doshiae]
MHNACDSDSGRTSVIFYNLLKRTFFVYAIIFVLYHASINHALAQTSNIQNIPAPQTYGAWTRVCSLPPGTPNLQCEIVQNVQTQNRHDITFRVTFYKLPKNQGALMRVFVPIRVELRLGVGLKIDDKNMGKMEYRRCLGDNCVAEAFLKEDILKLFLKGKTATYFIFTTPEQGVGGLIDLQGLSDAYATLPT